MFQLRLKQANLFKTQGAFYKDWYVLVGVLIGLLTLSLVMSVMSFKHLDASGPIKDNNRHSIIQDNDSPSTSVKNA